MTKFLFSRGILGLGAVLAALVALPAPAALAGTSSTTTSSCPNMFLTQPFLAYGDSNWYTLIPGESPDNVDGTGWTLQNGATLVTTGLADGSTGSVLNLPPGSKATTPMMCVESGMPLARTFARMVGGPTSNQTSFQVWNANGTPVGGAMGINGTASWAPSPPVNIYPGSFTGTKEVYFTFTANAKTGDLELYDFYVDPRMWH